jgi:hypothetical protein
LSVNDSSGDIRCNSATSVPYLQGNAALAITCKAALPASSKFTLTVPLNLFVTNFHLHSFLFYHFVCDSDIGIDVYNFEFTERKPDPEKVSTVAAS